MHTTKKIRNRYNRVAPFYDIMDAVMELGLFKKERPILVRQATGKVLEVGVGTGKNLPYYSHDSDVCGIDFSPRMLAKAKGRAADSGAHIQLMEMDVQALDFADNSFDSVLTSCVFCSVPDPVQGLKEIRRVLKPGGQLFMLEHMRSERPLIGKLMDWLNFMPVHLYGANINRRTLDNIREAGFTDVESTNAWSDIVKRIRVVND
jgi:ubiquinone/menaquinone biosynthesis C-methylase UbiE